MSETETSGEKKTEEVRTVQLSLGTNSKSSGGGDGATNGVSGGEGVTGELSKKKQAQKEYWAKKKVRD